MMLLMLPLSAHALGSVEGGAPPRIPSVAEANALLAGLGVKVKEVRQSPVRGLWEVVLEKGGARTLGYLDYQKRHLMPGPIFDLATGKLAGQEPFRPPRALPERPDASSIPLADAIVMGNPKGTKKLIVFTDPDCPYCARLHWELVKLTYMEPELTIYVKMFPLRIHPRAYDKARVILGEHSLKLLDKAFSGEPLPQPGPKDLAKSVDDSIRAGERLGIDSTPTLVLPDGRILPGVRSALDIKKLLTIEARR